MEAIIEPSPSEKLGKIAQSAKEKTTDSGFMEPGSKAPKKGRPSKEEMLKKEHEKKVQEEAKKQAELQKPPSQDSLMLGRFATQGISVAAVKWSGSERAQMTPDELDAGAEILARLADKWMPNVMSQYGLEATALMIFASYGMRVAAEARRVREEQYTPKEPKPISVVEEIKQEEK